MCMCIDGEKNGQKLHIHKWAEHIKFLRKKRQQQSFEFPFHFTKLVVIYSNEVKKKVLCQLTDQQICSISFSALAASFIYMNMADVTAIANALSLMWPVKWGIANWIVQCNAQKERKKINSNMQMTSAKDEAKKSLNNHHINKCWE